VGRWSNSPRMTNIRQKVLGSLSSGKPWSGTASPNGTRVSSPMTMMSNTEEAWQGTGSARFYHYSEARHLSNLVPNLGHGSLSIWLQLRTLGCTIMPVLTHCKLCGDPAAVTADHLRCCCQAIPTILEQPRSEQNNLFQYPESPEIFLQVLEVTARL